MKNWENGRFLDLKEFFLWYAEFLHSVGLNSRSKSNEEIIMEAIVNGKKFEIEGDMILIRPEAGDLLFVCEGKVYEWNVCMKLHEDVVVTDEDVVSESFDGWEDYKDT